MLGYMNREALQETPRGRVVFFSRTREKLWEKGETSGNTLELVSIAADCDSDACWCACIAGPTCHRNTPTCFGDGALPAGDGLGFLAQLEAVIVSRIAQSPEGSYTAKLYGQGLSAWRRKWARKAWRSPLPRSPAITANWSAKPRTWCSTSHCCCAHVTCRWMRWVRSWQPGTGRAR